jgi:predicted ATPase
MTDRYLTYIIGEPGVGKTTLIDAMTANLPFEEADTPFAHRVYECGVWELGRHREGGFSGTDALSLSVQPDVLQFMESIRPALVLGEGDRLGNNSFIRAMEALGYKITLWWLSGIHEARERRAKRALELGVKPQNETWLKGRQTKVKSLAERWDANTLWAGAPAEQMAASMGDPVSMRLRDARRVWTLDPANDKIRA